MDGNTKKKKILNAINRISQDVLPTQIDYTPEMKDKIKKLLNIKDNPIQPEAMSSDELSKKFGRRLSFFGGISTQKTLPFGTPQDVKNEVINRIKVLGKNNGYIISPSHEVTSDCKDENFIMLIKTLEDYKKGKINIF